MGLGWGYCNHCRFQVPVGASKCGHCGSDLTWAPEALIEKKDPAWVMVSAIISGGLYFLLNFSSITNATDGWLFPLLKVGAISLLIGFLVNAFIQPALMFLLFLGVVYIGYKILGHFGAF